MAQYLYGRWPILESLRAGRRSFQQLLLAEEIEEKGTVDAIQTAAQQHSVLLYDLNGLFARVRAGSVTVGNRLLSARYLGGFYTLSGSYPGATGHALIANEILALLNRTYGTAFPLVDVAADLPSDPAVRFRPTGFEGEME